MNFRELQACDIHVATRRLESLSLFLLLTTPFLQAQCSLDPDRDLGQILPGKNSVRAVVIGDFGDPGNQVIQEAVAAAVAARHSTSPFDIGLTVGDNFYPKGVKTVTDKKWNDIWEEDYGRKLKIPFFASLGNHDYKGNEKAQMDYAGQGSKTWRMPCSYYTFAAGPVRFFALDTDEGTSEGLFPGDWSPAPIAWLEKQLARHAKARWKVVYAHHPAFTDGNHYKQKRVKQVRERLVPVLKDRVQVYVAGHDHDLQYRKVDNVHYPVIGGGGRNNENRARKKKEAEFYELAYGFMILEASEAALKLEIVGGTPPGPFTTRKTGVLRAHSAAGADPPR